MTAPQITTSLHITHGVLSLDVGGLERIVLDLVRAGRGQGHRVSVVCLERTGALAPTAEADGALVRSLDKPPGRLPAFVRRAAVVLTELKPDVLHTHQIGPAWYLGKAARSLGIPVLHTEHGNEFARSAGVWQTIKSRLFFHRTAQYIDRFCCVSHEIADAVGRWGTVPRAKIEVVPNGINIAAGDPGRPPAEVRAALGIPQDAPVIGTVGRLAEVKRQDLLIRAAARLHPRFPGLHLVLVGDGPERANLERLAGELRLTGCVHFLGYQSCPEQFLRIMSVFCLTSRSEGFPVSLLEAWRAGLPVVCSAVGGIPQVVSDGQTGLLFPTGDVSAAADRIRNVLDEPALARRIGVAGHERLLLNYSLDGMVAGYHRHYRELIARGAGHRRPLST